MKTLASFALAALFLASFPLGTKAATTPLAGWQKGITIRPTSSTDFSSTAFQQSINNLAATGANYVTMIVPYFQTNPYTTDIGPGSDTPTDAALVAGIKYIHSKGMHVLLMPHVDSYTGEWRANINPSDRDTWFANYGNILTHLAQLAQQNGVEEMSVGSELIKMSTYTANPDNTQRWVDLIGQVRKTYKGKLTYSSNWGAPPGDANEKAHIGFWPQLDYVGISAYYDLNQASDNSVPALEAAWSSWLDSDIAPFAKSVGKPILFTEVGYRSVSWGYGHPWDFSMGGSPNQNDQANAYDAFFDFWSKQNFVVGVQLWNWSSDPNAGGEGNTDYTPQNKSAQAVMTKWFGGSGKAASNTNQTAQPATNVDTSVSVFPTGSLVLDHGTIYLITGQTKVGFANMKTFTGLGYSLKNVVPGNTSSYQASTIVLSSPTQAHPAGSWVINGKTVYYVTDSGLIPVSTWQIFLDNGGQAKFLAKANAADMGLVTLALMQSSDQRVKSI